MSTTPMQRPFLVGQNFDSQSFADHDLADHDLPRRALGQRGLHLVPQPLKRKMMIAGQPGNAYKAAALMAALFLALTII